jgi:vitamin B12 transporter
MKYFSTSLRLSALACACSTACGAYAQTAQAAPQLKEVVITATRSETRTDELVSEVVVITRAQLELATGSTLPEVLARSAGVQFASNGGLGKTSSIFIRGTEARHTIFLVDGIRFGSATTGTPTWENIPLSMIERIEVLKGPASSLYGSDGVGGVVQIFTRSGVKGFFPSASVTVGSRGYSQVAAGFSGGIDNLSYALGVQSTRDGGFSATNKEAQFGNFNEDNDGFKQKSANASLRWTFIPDWSVDTQLMQSDGKNQFDDGPKVDTRNSSQSSLAAFGVEGKIISFWKSRLSYGQSKDKFMQLSSANKFTVVPSNFDTAQTQLTWKNDFQTPIGLVTIGAEKLDQKVDSTTKYKVNERTIHSTFAGLNGAAGDHSWQANLRRDRNSQFGASSTGFIGYGYAITSNLRINVSHGTSFVAPSFNQLYFPNFGNEKLLPERSRNTEFGATYSVEGHTFKVIHFDNKIKGFITTTTLAANVPQARIDGWTVGYDLQKGPWTVRATADFFDAKNELTGKTLPRRNTEQMTLGIDYSTGDWKFGGSALNAEERFDNPTNTVKLAGYTTLDLHAEYKVAKDWAVQAKINNVTDKEYQTVFGYNQPGRGVFVTLRYQPK